MSLARLIFNESHLLLILILISKLVEYAQSKPILYCTCYFVSISQIECIDIEILVLFYSYNPKYISYI